MTENRLKIALKLNEKILNKLLLLVVELPEEAANASLGLVGSFCLRGELGKLGAILLIPLQTVTVLRMNMSSSWKSAWIWFRS